MMFHLGTRATLLAIMLLAPTLIAGPALAQSVDQDRLLVKGVATKFLAPRYQALAQASAQAVVQWEKACAGGVMVDPAPVRAAHRELALSFGAVQTFTLGPIGVNSTIERVYFWPERKNATARGLAALMAGADPITPERLAQASAAARGIPALEQLAWPDEEQSAIPQTRRCEAGRAIAQSLRETTAQISEAWNGPKGYIKSLSANRLDPGLGDNWRDAATAMVTGFATMLIAVQDYKVEPVLGKTPELARSFQAEARRSGLTTAMIDANLRGMREFVAALAGRVNAGRRKTWDEALHTLQVKVIALQDYPAIVDDPTRRGAVEILLADIKAARQIVETQIPPALGLSIGFNSLDGD